MLKKKKKEEIVTFYIKEVTVRYKVQYAAEVRTEENLANTRKKALTQLAIYWRGTIKLESGIRCTRFTHDFQHRIIVLIKKQNLPHL